MPKSCEQTEAQRELNETLELSNKVVSFFEEFIDAQNEKIAALEVETKRLGALLNESKDLLRVALGTPKRSIVN